MISIRLKAIAAGRTLHVELLATDDFGRVQGFEEAGTLTVEP